jgi:hypothetical protein
LILIDDKGYFTYFLSVTDLENPIDDLDYLEDLGTSDC